MDRRTLHSSVVNERASWIPGQTADNGHEMLTLEQRSDDTEQTVSVVDRLRVSQGTESSGSLPGNRGRTAVPCSTGGAQPSC